MNVGSAILSACEATLKLTKRVIIRQAHAADAAKMKDLMSSDKCLQPRHGPKQTNAIQAEACRLDGVPNYFGIVVEEGKACVGFATFYLAYSTWDARVLYLDKLFLAKDNSNASLEWSLHFTLADIALRLECARYTWQVSSAVRSLQSSSGTH